MAQWFGVIAALAEVFALNPSVHTVDQNQLQLQIQRV